jgi:single-stranded-DNA-specific exonuclease RecJ
MHKHYGGFMKIANLPGPKAQALIERDKKVVSPSYPRDYPFAMSHGKGTEVWDLDGNRFLDFMAGIAVNATGHSHPQVVKAIQEQAGKFIHISSDFYHEKWVELSEKLNEIAPFEEQARVFLTNSGTEAVETAIKLARYHTKRTNFIGFTGAFHGRTMGSVTFTASKANYHRGFYPLMNGVVHAPYPNPYRPILERRKGEDYGETVVRYIEEQILGPILPPDEVAGIMVETIQGEGGYIVPPENFYPALRALCDKHGILLILDEVQSGMGRTGKWWAIDHFGVEPDMITSAKGIASGMPLGACIARESVMDWPRGIAVYGDYDVDGVTATALLVSALRALGGNAREYIPNRFEEGYGLNTDALDTLKNEGASLVISVDCGIRSPAEADHARAIGLDLIITDHHEPAGDLPQALAVINPKQPGDEYPEKYLAGVGIAYKIAQALQQTLSGLDTPQNQRLLDLRPESLLDLVALGTVADLAPLTGENRHLVRGGLRQMRNSARQGLLSLAAVSDLSLAKVTAINIGFGLGPRLNASGRLDSALASYKLLTTTDLFEAGQLAQQLNVQNSQRQQLTRKIQADAEALALAEEQDPLILFAVHDEFNPGVVGLAAARLTDSYYRPSVVGHSDPEKGETRCSCRSIPEFHITQALDECADLLVRHGGHAAAAGFTVPNENLDALKARLREIAVRELGSKDLRHTFHKGFATPLQIGEQEKRLKWLQLGGGSRKIVAKIADRQKGRSNHRRDPAAGGKRGEKQANHAHRENNRVGRKHRVEQIERDNVSFNLAFNRLENKHRNDGNHHKHDARRNHKSQGFGGNNLPARQRQGDDHFKASIFFFACEGAGAINHRVNAGYQRHKNNQNGTRPIRESAKTHAEGFVEFQICQACHFRSNRGVNANIDQREKAQANAPAQNAVAAKNQFLPK